MQIKPYGNQALLVEVEAIIDPVINQQIIQLHNALTKAKIKGIQGSIPAYASLTVCYDPLIISFEKLSSIIQELAIATTNKTTAASQKLFIPVCYDLPFALDISAVLTHTQLQKQALIELHTQTVYQVYLLGFLPGFAYLGKAPKTLYCPRKASPRLRVPEGSVGLAGYQTGIYPSASPGGWQIIGQTPIPVFRPTIEQPFLFQPGDQVQFKSIDKETFVQIKNDLAQEQFNWESIYHE